MQLDEPCLVLDLDAPARQALQRTYAAFAEAVPQLRIMLNTYFGELSDNLDLALSLPVAGLHLDLVRAPDQFDEVAAKAPKDLVLSLGVIDGRNIWRSDLSSLLDGLEPMVDLLGRIALSSRRPVRCCMCRSISALRPISIRTSKAGWLFRSRRWKSWPHLEQRWLAAALMSLQRLSRRMPRRLRDWHRRRSTILRSPNASPLLTRQCVVAGSDLCHARCRTASTLQTAGIPDNDHRLVSADRGSEKRTRSPCQGTLSDAAYKTFLQNQTARAVRWQENIGLDVLVHGEFERNDMVQYFGEQLSASPSPSMAGSSPMVPAVCGHLSCLATCPGRIP